MMEPFVRNFLRAALVWLAVAGILGLAMAFVPRAAVYRPAHLHAALLGWVSMFIFGVAYHVLPRFTGRPLASRWLPTAHFWLANAGLASMVAGWMLRPTWARAGTVAVHAGGTLTALGLAFFIYLIWRLLEVREVPAAARRAVGGQAGPGAPGPGGGEPGAGDDARLIQIRNTSHRSDET